MIFPSVYLSGLPRSTSKPLWKAIYRLARVTVREASKAATDMLLFGTGTMMHPKNGDDPYHIPYGRSPAMDALPSMKEIQSKPLDEQAAESVRFVRNMIASGRWDNR